MTTDIPARFQGWSSSALKQYIHDLELAHAQKIEKLEADKAKLVECVKLYVSCENIGHLVASSQVLEKSHQCLKDLGIGREE